MNLESPLLKFLLDQTIAVVILGLVLWWAYRELKAKDEIIKEKDNLINTIRTQESDKREKMLEDQAGVLSRVTLSLEKVIDGTFSTVKDVNSHTKAELQDIRAWLEVRLIEIKNAIERKG